MYKAKLQELCHQSRWGLPKYSSIKEGPDHNPRFKTSVIINGVSFNSPNICTSSKDANNAAAKLAFLHFTSPSPSPSIEEAHENYENSSKDSEDKNDEHGEESAAEEKCKGVDIQIEAPVHNNVMQHQYKSQLYNYARGKHIDLPVYSSELEGPPHARKFKVKVKVDGHAFESSKFFNTLKEGEHDAAKVALMSLLSDGFQEVDYVLYKNLLQELVQKEGLGLPSYKTVKCGMPHMLTFYCTVELEGEIFNGKGAKSKKQAEINAAKVAHFALKERKLGNVMEGKSPGYSMGGFPHITPSLDTSDPSALKIGGLSALSIENGDTKKTTRTGSYLLCNRVRVYPFIPDFPLPDGVTVLPISDDKWVAVTLEFPNEKGF